jgi:hypothetical protein
MVRDQSDSFSTREELFTLAFIGAHWFTVQLTIASSQGPILFMRYALSILLILGVVLSRRHEVLLGIAIGFPSYVFYLAPKVPNHAILLSLVDLLVLGALSKEWIRGAKPFAQSMFAGWNLILAGVYLFAVLAKLNTAFLSSDSCAIKFFDHVSILWLSRSLDIGPASIAGFTIIIELALLLLAVFNKPKWTPLLCLGGVLLHAGLALDLVKGFLNFSSVMYLLYAGVLFHFIPKGSVIRSPLPGRLPHYALILLVVSHVVRPQSEVYALWFVFFGFWVLFYVLLIYTVVLLIRQHPIGTPPFEGLPWGALLICGLVLINGSGPYLGFKTRNSFNMYSNLWMTTENSNHLLFSSSLDLFGYLRESVIIEESDDPQLPMGSEIPYFELYRQVCANPQYQLRFRSTKESVATLASCSSLPPPRFFPILRKFLFFRPLQEAVSRECLW